MLALIVYSLAMAATPIVEVRVAPDQPARPVVQRTMDAHDIGPRQEIGKAGAFDSGP